jgi:arabinose-5-phosphate isomerase
MSALPAVPLIPSVTLDQLREARDILLQESAAIQSASRHLGTTFCDAAEALRACTGAVVITGVGKAGLIGAKFAATLSSTGTRAFFMHPVEAVHGDLGCVRPGDVVVALSNSGETDELLRIAPAISNAGATLISITSRSTSSLGRASDIVIEFGSHAEAGVLGLAPSTTTTVMLAVADALALVVSRRRGFTRDQFAAVHPAGALGRQFRTVSDIMRSGDAVRIASQSETVRGVFTATNAGGRRTGAVMLVDDEGRLSGLFTDSDFVRLVAARRESQLDACISEVMTCRPKTVRPDAPMTEAIDLLSKHRISELPVIDAECRPVGLIDITDVISFMPEERPE